MRRFYLFLIVVSILNAKSPISKEKEEILSKSFYYIDYSCTLNITQVINKKFKPINKDTLGLGYSPPLNLWIKVEITNSSNDTITKILEYENALTSSIEFFSANPIMPLKWDGLLVGGIKDTIYPYLELTFEPQETKIIYIKAHSDITTLIAKLNLLNKDVFLKKEQKRQFILAFFLGALTLIIIYNFIFYIFTRYIRYLYYVLFFVTITLHNILYQGVAKLFIPANILQKILEFVPLIVALPVLFLVLFTQSVLELPKYYPRLNKILNIATIIFIIVTIIVYIFNMHTLRSIFVIIYLSIAFSIVVYSFFKKKW